MRCLPFQFVLFLIAGTIAVSFENGHANAQQPVDNWRGFRQTQDDSTSWYDIELGYMSLYRTEPDAFPFVFIPGPTAVLDMNQLAGGGGRGIDLMLNRRSIIGGDNPVDFQMRFFESRDMLSMRTIESSPIVVPVFYNGIPVDPTNSYNIEYETDLQSAELNFRTPIFSRIYAVAGMRYLEVEERFDVIDNPNSTPPTLFTGFFSNLDNDAIGGQLGLEGQLLSGKRGHILGSIKWGLLSNAVRGMARAADPSGSPLSTLLVQTESTQLIDIQLGGVLSLTNWLGLYAGYQGLIGTDIALGPTQSRVSSLTPPSIPVLYESTHWHGYRIGATITW